MISCSFPHLHTHTHTFSSYIVKPYCKKSHPTQLRNYIYHPQQLLAGFPISNCSRCVTHKQKVETLLCKRHHKPPERTADFLTCFEGCKTWSFITLFISTLKILSSTLVLNLTRLVPTWDYFRGKCLSAEGPPGFSQVEKFTIRFSQSSSTAPAGTLKFKYAQAK